MIKKTLLFQSPAHLSTAAEQLCAHLPQTGEKRQVPIDDIGLVLLDHPQITVTQPLLSKLLAHQVALIVCDEKHLPLGLFMVLSGHTLQTQRFGDQIGASEPLKKQLWQQVVRAKIQNQAALIHSLGMPAARLFKLAENVKSGDPDNREGQAAAYFWARLFGDVLSPESLEGERFLRDRYGEPPNHLLNYGYAVLRAIVARALVASGLLPTLGIHHRNQYNAYCLADDMMEPYRPFLDRLVVRFLQEIAPDECPEELSPDLKRRLLAIATVDVEIDGQTSPLWVAVSRTTASLAKCFSGEQRKLLLPCLEIENIKS